MEEAGGLVVCRLAGDHTGRACDSNRGLDCLTKKKKKDMNKNVQDFVIETIQSIASKIPGISIRYAYDIQTNFHIVEVSPESIRRGSEEYMEMEYNLCNEFQEKFPEEDLLVSDPDKINNMENLIFEI
nr:MAG TPA: hypothetical protein [Caudoviricetes sp.]